MIPSGVLNRLAKLTSRNPSIHDEVVENMYPDHAKNFRKAGLAPPVFPSMGDLWRKQYENMDIEKEQDISKKKNRNVYFCVAYSLHFSTSIHRVIDRIKSHLTSHVWEYECHTGFNNLAELLNVYLAAKIGQVIFSKYLMDRECNFSLPPKVNGKGKCRSR